MYFPPFSPPDAYPFVCAGALPGESVLGLFGGAALDIYGALTRHVEFYALRGELCDLQFARSGHRRLDHIAVGAVGFDRTRPGQLDRAEPGHGDRDIDIVMIAEVPARCLAPDRQPVPVALDFEPVERVLPPARADRESIAAANRHIVGAGDLDPGEAGQRIIQIGRAHV